MRTAFINQLIEEAENNDRIFLVVGDLGYSVVEPFKEKYPDRFLNIGIDEQNMIGVAAGLAMQGFNVYVYSIGNFPTLRCMEQIRYDVAYHNLSVKIVSVGAGYAYGTLGPSHHATEELGMIRTIPNVLVCSPSDTTEASEITSISANYNGPMYIRLGKAGEKQIYSSCSKIEIGKIHCYQESDSENVLFVTGSIMDYAVNWIKCNNVDTAIYSVPFVKPLLADYLVSVVNKHHNIIVLEEHQKTCGLASALIEQISDLFYLDRIDRFPKIKRLAINDIFVSVAGSQSYLRELAALTLNRIFFK